MKFDDLKKANPSVNGPTLPRYIVRTKTILLKFDKSGVMPKLNPTVPNAEVVSNKDSINVWLSKRQSIRVAAVNTKTYKVEVATAVITLFEGIS